MALTQTQVASNQLERVLPKVTTLFEREDHFYSSIEKKNVEVISNRDMRIPLELRTGGKFGMYSPDGGDMGRGGGPTYDKAVINVVHFKMGCEWTELADIATDNARKAVVKTVTEVLAKGMKELRRQLDGVCMTDGTGVIATVGSVSAGGGTGGGDRLTLNSDGFRAKLPRFGQDVNIFDTTLATNRTLGAEREIVYVDLANNIIDIKAPSVAGLVAGDKVVLSGVTSAPPVSLLGVQYHNNAASTGTWLGFTRSSTPEIRANQVNASGAALALPFARLAMNKVGDRLGMDHGNSYTAWMHPAQVAAHEELAQATMLINKEPSEQKVNQYFGGFQLAGCPAKAHFNWDRTRIDFLSPEFFGRAEMKPLGYKEVGGNRIFPIYGTSGGLAASQIFYLTVSFNLFTTNPASGAYVSNLAVPAGY